MGQQTFFPFFSRNEERPRKLVKLGQRPAQQHFLASSIQGFCGLVCGTPVGHLLPLVGWICRKPTGIGSRHRVLVLHSTLLVLQHLGAPGGARPASHCDDVINVGEFNRGHRNELTWVSRWGARCSGRRPSAGPLRPGTQLQCCTCTCPTDQPPADGRSH